METWGRDNERLLVALERNKARSDIMRHDLALSYCASTRKGEPYMEAILAGIGDGEYGVIWVIVGVLAIIALLLFILRGRA